MTEESKKQEENKKEEAAYAVVISGETIDLARAAGYIVLKRTETYIPV